MSNESNVILFERAYQAADEITNHPSGLDKSIYQAIEDNNLDEVRRLTVKAEGLLAQAHFYNNNMIEPTEVY